jgi:hypothetical protein
LPGRNPTVADAMRRVDTEAEPRLDGTLSEIRAQARRDAVSGR